MTTNHERSGYSAVKEPSATRWSAGCRAPDVDGRAATNLKWIGPSTSVQMPAVHADCPRNSTFRTNQFASKEYSGWVECTRCGCNTVDVLSVPLCHWRPGQGMYSRDVFLSLILSLILSLSFSLSLSLSLSLSVHHQQELYNLRTGESLMVF